jgi:hypothetical protein
MTDKTYNDLGAQTTMATSDLLAAYPTGGPLKKITQANFNTYLATLFLPLNGSGAMSGALSLADGTANNPSLAFSSAPTSGLYYVSSGTIGISAGGVDQAHISSGGMNFVVAPLFSSTATATRSNLGCGTVATYNTGTSGATVPLLNTANTWSARQTVAISASGSEAAPMAAQNTAAYAPGCTGVMQFYAASGADPARIGAYADGGANGAGIIGIVSFASNGIVAFQFNKAGHLQLNQYGAGTLSTDSSGNVTASSDARLKNVLGSFTRGLTDLKNVGGPVIYDWIAEKTQLQAENKPVTQYAGFTADAVELGIPEAVGVGPDGYKTLDSRPLVAALFNAVLELDARLTALGG